VARRNAKRTAALTARQAALAIGAALAVVVVAIVLIPVPRGGLDFRGVAAASAPAAATTFRETRWYELGPPGWDADKELRELRRNASTLVDSDARAVALLKRSREIWDNAPVNPAMDGAAIRIPGYVVPLDEDHGRAKEFLLVPYFGACIHSPPPPSNQILHVKLREPVRGLRSMDTYWVSGTLAATKTETSMGVSGFTLDAGSVERYIRAP
jgi:hypothetical protein